LLATSNPSFFLSVPDMNLRTLWGRQSTDLEISSSVAPLLRNRSDVIFAAFVDLVRFSSSLAIGGSPLSGTPIGTSTTPGPQSAGYISSAIVGLIADKAMLPSHGKSSAKFITVTTLRIFRACERFFRHPLLLTSFNQVTSVSNF
jgi:hypothetical protein